MRNLFILLATICGIQSAAARIQIDGDVTWDIKRPECTFAVSGNIVNTNPLGTTSGTLRLVLWATTKPFPSPGKIIAEANIGVLQGGFQAVNLKRKVAANTQQLTGKYHFSVALLEFTTLGWATRDFVATGQKTLNFGDFVTGSKWTAPSKTPAEPPIGLAPGNRFSLDLRANEDLDAITPGTESTLQLTVRSNTRMDRKFGPEKSSVPYEWSSRRSTFNGLRYVTLRLVLNPKSVNPTRIVFYFESPTRGFYKQSAPGRTTWGTFRFR